MTTTTMTTTMMMKRIRKKSNANLSGGFRQVNC